jgi:hypothetical protein
MRQAAFVVAACAVGLLTLGGAGAGAAPPDWKSLPNYDYTNQRMRLSTDRTWSGARYVNAGHLNWEPDPSWSKLKREWIWSATCGRQAQHVVFTKQFLAPGVPVEGTLSLYYGPGNQFLGFRPYQSAIYEINGIAIGRLGNVHQFPKKNAAELSSEPLSQRALHAFRHGINTATIRVVRAPLKPGDSCTRPNTSRNFRIIAVESDLSLLFGADLRAIPPRVAHQVQKVTSGSTVTIRGTVQFANFGPSTSLGGRVSVNAGGDGQTVFVTPLTIPGPGLTDCERDQASITCTYPQLLANTSTSIALGVSMKVSTGLFVNGAGRLRIDWHINRPGLDPNTGNNNAATEVVVCVEGATDPACG